MKLKFQNYLSKKVISLLGQTIFALAPLLIVSFNCFAQTSEVEATGEPEELVLNLNPEQIESFKEQATRSVTDLSKHIEVIGNKQESMTRRNSAINLAVKLFSSEDNVVQTSSLNSPTIKSRKIREYLNKIKVLQYDQVKITWYDIYISSDFTKMPNGKYEAIATIYQRFEGLNNSEMGNYVDITQKNIQIIVELVEEFEGAEKKDFWKLYLGDIMVVETKKG